MANLRGVGGIVDILLLEDDAPTAGALAQGLRDEGHRVDVTADVAGALQLLDRPHSYEGAILDIMVPDGSGLEVLDTIRRRTFSIRVLILTARGDVAERVDALDRGADDYVVKPFAFPELMARVRALHRRNKEAASQLQRGGLYLDLNRRTASAASGKLNLTVTEFSLATALLAAEGDAVSKRQLLAEVWGYDFDPRTNVVEVHVNRLRRKLEGAGLGDLIRTVRGHGYAAR